MTPDYPISNPAYENASLEDQGTRGFPFVARTSEHPNDGHCSKCGAYHDLTKACVLSIVDAADDPAAKAPRRPLSLQDQVTIEVSYCQLVKFSATETARRVIALIANYPHDLITAREAFLVLHEKWLLAEKREDMNKAMDTLSVALGCDPLNPRAGGDFPRFDLDASKIQAEQVAPNPCDVDLLRDENAALRKECAILESHRDIWRRALIRNSQEAAEEVEREITSMRQPTANASVQGFIDAHHNPIVRDLNLQIRELNDENVKLREALESYVALHGMSVLAREALKP